MPPRAGWLLYDGACSLCASAAEALSRWDLDRRLSLLDLRTADLGALPARLTRDEAAAALRLIEPDGRASAGFDAVRRLSVVLPALWPAAPVLHFPGARVLLEPAYEALARLRLRLGSPR